MDATGTFLVVEGGDGDGVVLRDVETGQLHTLSAAEPRDGEANPAAERSPAEGLVAGEVVEATLSPDEPHGLTWTARLEARREIATEHVDLEPTRRSIEAAEDLEVGDLERFERAGEGEVHALAVPAGEEDAAAADVLADEATVERAARLGAVRVEVRTAPGLVSVRYLPE